MQLRIAALWTVGFCAGVAVFVAAFEILSLPFPVPSGLRGDYPSKYAFHNFVARSNFTYSTGWKFEVVARGRTNNLGFPSQRDYSHEPNGILLLGDSYVEALMLDPAKSIPSIIEDQLPGFRVFPLGVSGASAATYLSMAEFGQRTVAPKFAVVAIVAGDIEESITSRIGQPFFMFNADGVHLETPPIRKPSWLETVLAKPRLAQYVRRNLHFSAAMLRPQRFSTSSSPTTVQTSERDLAIDFFLAELPARVGLPVNRIALVVDSDRKGMNAAVPEEIPNSDPGSMVNTLKHVSRRAAKQGFTVIETEQMFKNYMRESGQRVDFMPVDYHWNEAAHRLVGNAIANWIQHADASKDRLKGTD